MKVAPENAAITNELHAYQRMFQPMYKHLAHSAMELDRKTLLARMLETMPPKEVCDLAVTKYFNNWEKLYRILHFPSFRREYDLFWQHRDSPPEKPEYPRHMLPQILAILSITTPLRDDGRNMAADNKSAEYAHYVSKWMDSLFGRQKVQFAMLQTQILLHLALRNMLLPLAKLWRDTGDMVRRAMMTGLHRDPSECPGIEHFSGEQRRKIWTTVVELDLEMSLITGLPAAIRSSDYDCDQLRNVNDWELMPDMQQLPPSKPLTEWTDSTAQIILSLSLPLRLDAANLLSNAKLPRDAKEIQRMSSRLSDHLNSYHRRWNFTMDAPERAAGNLLATVLIDIELRRSLLALNRCLILASPNIHGAARTTALNSSMAVVSHLDAFDPAVADPKIITSNEHWNLFHVLCQKDLVQALLMICFEIQAFNSSSKIRCLNDMPADSQLLTGTGMDRGGQQTWSKPSLTRIVENALTSFISRFGACSSDLRDAITLSVFLQSVRTDGTEEEKRELMIKGAERVLEACRKVSLLTVDALAPCPHKRKAHMDTSSNANLVPTPSADMWAAPVNQAVVYPNDATQVAAPPIDYMEFVSKLGDVECHSF